MSGPISRRRKVLLAISAVCLVLVGGVALWVLPLFVGPALPAGATRLHITTAAPNLSFGRSKLSDAFNLPYGIVTEV